MLIGETFHQEGKLSTYRLYTYKGHVCRGSAEGYPIHLQREPSRDCEESAKKNNQKFVVNVYFLCFINIILYAKSLHLVNFQTDLSNAHDFVKTSVVMTYTNSITVARKVSNFPVLCYCFALEWESFSGYCIWIWIRINCTRL